MRGSIKILKYSFTLILIIIISCKDNTKELNRIKLIYSILKTEYAPDKRTELFDIEFDNTKEKLILKGEVSNLSPYFKLKNSLTRASIKYDNKLRILPDSAVGSKWYAIVKNSVVNLRNQPSYADKIVNQGLLGTSLKVLDKKNDFYRIQTPDKYISWVDKKEIIRMNKAKFIEWNKSKKIIFMQNSGFVYTDSNFLEYISDITLGSILKLVTNHKGYYEIEYPDKRKGFIKKHEASIYTEWTKKLPPNDLMKRRQLNIENIAKSFINLPYSLGGNSTKGMDGSGFVKLVFLMNGFIIPRDVTQQINVGKTVDVRLDFSNLDKGDLIFFGRKATKDNKHKATDVGIWLGNENLEFIHVSENIHISSMNENHPLFDQINKKRYIKSKRYLGIKDKNIIDLKKYKIRGKKLRKFGPLFIDKSNNIY